MAGTILVDTSRVSLLRAQLAALEAMYLTERTCMGARRVLDLIHAKRDELAQAEMVQSWAA